MKTLQIHCDGTIHYIYYIETNISRDQNGMKFEYKSLWDRETVETNDHEMIKLG